MSAEAVKITAGITGVAATLPAIILGIQVGTLSAATAGALLSLAYSRPESWGKSLELPEGPLGRRMVTAAGRVASLALVMAANAIVAAWAVSAAPHVPGFAWTANVPPMPLAGLLAFAAQHLVPKVLALAGRLLDGRAPQ